MTTKNNGQSKQGTYSWYCYTFLCPGGLLSPPVPRAGRGHHAEGRRQGGEVIQGRHDDNDVMISVTIGHSYIVTSGIGGRSQTDLGNGPVSGTAGPRTRGRVMEAGALEAGGQDTWGTHGGGQWQLLMRKLSRGSHLLWSFVPYMNKLIYLLPVAFSTIMLTCFFWWKNVMNILTWSWCCCNIILFDGGGG